MRINTLINAHSHSTIKVKWFCHAQNASFKYIHGELRVLLLWIVMEARPSGSSVSFLKISEKRVHRFTTTNICESPSKADASCELVYSTDCRQSTRANLGPCVHLGELTAALQRYRAISGASDRTGPLDTWQPVVIAKKYFWVTGRIDRALTGTRFTWETRQSAGCRYGRLERQ